jgi:cell division transport system permease protein
VIRIFRGLRPLELPLEDDGAGRFLPWMIALMVYLAALALAAGTAP